MEAPVTRPETIDKLRFAADSYLAALAGMQLDLFTPLKDGPKTAEEIAQATGVGPARLRLLLYSLVAAELLAEQADVSRIPVRRSNSWLRDLGLTLATDTQAFPLKSPTNSKPRSRLGQEFRKRKSISLTLHWMSSKRFFEE